MVDEIETSSNIKFDKEGREQIVDELERSGLLVRKTAEDDRRAYALIPTPAGCNLCRQAMAAAVEQDAKLTQGLSEVEIEMLHGILWKIQANARTVEAPGPC